MYSKFLKSKLVLISAAQQLFGFQTVRISDTFVQCLKSRHFSLDFRHLMCLKTQQTKFWISDT